MLLCAAALTRSSQLRLLPAETPQQSTTSSPSPPLHPSGCLPSPPLTRGLARSLPQPYTTASLKGSWSGSKKVLTTGPFNNILSLSASSDDSKPCVASTSGTLALDKFEVVANSASVGVQLWLFPEGSYQFSPHAGAPPHVVTHTQHRRKRQLTRAMPRRLARSLL